MFRNKKGALGGIVGIFIGVMIAAIILFNAVIPTIGPAMDASTHLNGSARTLAFLTNLFLVLALIIGILAGTGIMGRGV